MSKKVTLQKNIAKNQLYESHQPHQSRQSRGFGTLEIILAVSVFAVGMIAVGLLMIDVIDTSENSSSLNQAILISAEGIEAVKSIRNHNFESIANGTYGLSFDDETGDWSLSNEESDKIISVPTGFAGTRNFTREIIIDDSSLGNPTDTSTTVKVIESKVTWNRRISTGTTSLFTYITNWSNIETDVPEEEEEGEGE
ncbi:MAG TPA: hypothetical protein PKA60_02665 [Candidatus Paceibacterota bacterium]|nr:hypothetical protein [Candidatus Paceibacterota bacterium]